MISENYVYWGLKKLKSKIHKMSNEILLIELKNVRSINSRSCGNSNLNCQHCKFQEKCDKYVTYEEAITDELLTRGLFDYALKFLKNESNKFERTRNQNDIELQKMNFLALPN